MAGWWGEQASARIARIQAVGAAEGLELNLHLARPVNTFDAPSWTVTTTPGASKAATNSGTRVWRTRSGKSTRTPDPRTTCPEKRPEKCSVTVP
jgi:hypothetical protein